MGEKRRDEPRYRLLALVKAEAFTPYVQRQGEKLHLSVGDAQWFRENIPCQQACPVHTDIPRYIGLIAQGDYDGAYEVNRRSNLWPTILGRVCPHPCEAACRRGLIDQPLAICNLKRAAADYRTRAESAEPSRRPVPHGDRTVAIIGSGPAGLTAAHDLANLGYVVTVYEALEEAGGMLWAGIPPYRLPREFVREAVEELEGLGVEIKLGVKIGRDIELEDLLARHDAVLLAAGAQRPVKLGIPGEGAAQVIPGLEFMYKVNTGGGQGPGLDLRGKRVAVIGGGYTAIDCARSAVRLGAEVFLFYRRTRAEMPATATEVEEAIEEGVEVQYLVSPLRILTDAGRVRGLECIRNELGEPDETGRRRPIPIEGSQFTIEVDLVIPATGQAPELEILREAGGELSPDGLLRVDEALQTARPGLFAAGDCVTGPRTVVEAIAAGHRAAASIDRYLSREASRESESGAVATRRPQSTAPPASSTDEADHLQTLLRRRLSGEDDYEEIERHRMPTLPVGERLDLRREVELGYSREEAAAEARRCYRCQLNIFVRAEECILCNKCVEVCPHGCLMIISFDRAANGGGDLPGMAEARSWLDGGALVLDETSCTRCGKCLQACPPQCMTMEQFEGGADG